MRPETCDKLAAITIWHGKKFNMETEESKWIRHISPTCHPAFNAERVLPRLQCKSLWRRNTLEPHSTKTFHDLKHWCKSNWALRYQTSIESKKRTHCPLGQNGPRNLGRKAVLAKRSRTFSNTFIATFTNGHQIAMEYSKMGWQQATKFSQS